MSNKRRYYFDIESAPLEGEALARMKPEFLPDARLKDAEKIKESITAKEQEWTDRAALSPLTGKIIAYSCAWDKEPATFHTNSEAAMLVTLLDDLMTVIGSGATAYSFNGFGFDLPFICMRCAVNNIPAHFRLMTSFKGRWAWNECFVDAMQVWTGPYQPHSGHSLKNVALALGVGEKTGDGKDFAALLKTDPEKAKAYCIMDVELLRKIVQKMGI